MTKEEILEDIEETTTDIANIEAQIEGAEAKPTTIDHQWLRNAIFAKRKKKEYLQKLYMELGVINSKIKAENSSRIERAFVNIARDSLSKDLFGYIMTRALKEVEDA